MVTNHQTANTVQSIVLRRPTVSDGAAMWELVKRSGSLDPNSPYAYLMACKNFPDACVVAECGGEMAGMVVAYYQPHDPTTLFLWQIGVDHAHRGKGLGLTMLQWLLATAQPAFSYLDTTITPSNQASVSLFRAFARSVGAPVQTSEWLAASDFPDAHEGEDLYRIGPFANNGE